MCFCLPTVLQREHVFPIIKFTKVKYIFYNFIVSLVMWMFQSQRAYSSQNTGSKFLCLWLFDGYFFFIKVVCSEIWWLLPYWQIKTVLLLNQTIQMVPCFQCSFRCWLFGFIRIPINIHHIGGKLLYQIHQISMETKWKMSCLSDFRCNTVDISNFRAGSCEGGTCRGISRWLHLKYKSLCRDKWMQCRCTLCSSLFVSRI